MKILFNGYPENLPKSTKQIWGGPQAFTQELAKFIVRSGHIFAGLILESKKDAPDFYEITRTSALSGSWITVCGRLHIANIVNSKSSNINRYSSGPIAAITQVLGVEKPDVVLLNGFSLKNWYLLRAAKLAGIPVVVSHHGLWFKEVSEVAHRMAKTTVKILERMESDIKRYADHEIFLNGFSKKEFEKKYGRLSQKKTSIVPISYNSTYKISRAVGKPRPVKGRLQIGFVGRWDPIKRPEIVYAVAREAQRQKKNWNFYAVTHIWESKTLKPLAKKFAKSITVLSPRKPAELKKFFKKMDVLLLPSRFDVSPTVVLEAALQDRATVISPQVGWVDDYKKFGMLNFIDTFENPSKVVHKIEALAHASVPRQFKKHLQNNFSTNVVMKQYLSIFKSVILSNI